VSHSINDSLITELRSAAKTLRTEGIGYTLTNKLSAELLDRAAEALETAYTPSQVAAAFRSGLNTARMEETLQERSEVADARR
jgi:hypothetical protein